MFEDFRIRIFMEVASEGSFTKAAKNIGISQPAVSQNISELEKTLGVALFERMRGEVTLTDAGKTFKAYADNIMHWYHAAGDVFVSAKDKSVKNIKIACDSFIASSILPQVISSMISGGEYHFNVRTTPLGDEDIILSLKPHSDKIDFDSADSFVESIPAAFVVSQRTKETLDKKRKFMDNIPVVIWSEYEDLLPLDIKSRVVVNSGSVEGLRSIIEENAVLGIVPDCNSIIDSFEKISHKLASLQFELFVSLTNNSALSNTTIKVFRDELTRVVIN